jgi:hypothetical protein
MSTYSNAYYNQQVLSKSDKQFCPVEKIQILTEIRKVFAFCVNGGYQALDALFEMVKRQPTNETLFESLL